MQQHESLMWAGMFVLLGVIIVLNRAPENPGWFILLGGVFVFAGLLGAVGTLFPPRRWKR